MTKSRRALFLDRDGVINLDHGYVHEISNFHFIDGVFASCRAAHELGFVVLVVTNQAGIAKGYYTEDDYFRLTEWMLARFSAEGVEIKRVYHCPFHPDGTVENYRRVSDWRKPGPGMLLAAQTDFDLDMAASVLVGDKESDILAGRAAGLGATILVRSGITTDTSSTDADVVLNSIAEVGSWLRSRDSLSLS